MVNVLLITHILAGVICLTCGIFAMLSKKRKGKHTLFGEVYHWSYVLVFVTSLIMSILNWEKSQYLFYIALFSYGLALFSYLAVKKKWENWLGSHIGGMLGSYIGIVTASLVVNVPKIPVLNELPVLLFWFLPTLIGTPIIFNVGSKYRPNKNN